MSSLTLDIRKSSNTLHSGNSSNITHAGCGRVLDVILDDSHPRWKDMGCSQGQYGVFFQVLYQGRSTDLDPEINFAYCRQSTFRRIPVKNEIVTLVREICLDRQGDLGSSYIEKTYWETIVPIWNHPHLNVYPDLTATKGNVDTGKDFKESDKVQPLQLNPGDVSIEGRHGQTIRFGGTSYASSPVATEDTNGDPYTIIVNGQNNEGEEGCKSRYEDINKDKTSIYLLSNHKVSLEQANEKRKAWSDRKGPELAKDYKGPQLIFNSGRLYLNARDYDIELSAKKCIGLNADDNISLDAEKYIAFDAKKIYLGTDSFVETEPVLLGNTTTNWLRDLSSYLSNFLKVAGVPLPPAAYVASVAAAANTAKGAIDQLKLDPQLKKLHSKKSFVE